MKLKFIAAAALSVLGLASGTAQAATTALGAAVVGTPLSFGGLAAPGPFSDIFTFTLPANGGSGYSVSNFTLLPGIYGTALTTLTLMSNADGILFNGDDTFVSSSSTPGGASIGLSVSAQAAGNYYINVTGITTAPAGGIYTGAISVTAVPEPETYAMMLAGLAALGFLARRRQG
jgi:hypothetical protein